MNILYFGTVCDLNNYESLLKECNKKPTSATVVFETALLAGMKKNNANVEVWSFPMIPAFPGSKLLRFGGASEKLTCGYTCNWLNTVNLPVFKQLSRRLSARKAIKNWAKKNEGDGVILLYSIPPFMVKDVVKLSRKYNLKAAAIVPDLPQNMYINHRKNVVLYKLKQLYLRSSLKYQSLFDGYVYLTRHMKDVIAPGKPYIVLEGIHNSEAETGEIKPVEKSCPRSIMYAGRLHEKYGILNLLDAFELINDTEAQLWIFGDGTAVSEIENRAKKDDRIKYFGRLAYEEILEYEKRATLLINPRSVKDEFTKYSFPSKTIEYMHSGTPVLTTRLEGIPEEYNEYVFMADDNDPVLLSEAINEILALSDDELRKTGEKAKAFIINKKNEVVQSKSILDFLTMLSGD